MGRIRNQDTRQDSAASRIARPAGSKVRRTDARKADRRKSDIAVTSLAAALGQLSVHERNERFKALTADQQATLLEHMDPTLQLTPEERQRRDAAWALADAGMWQQVASSNVIHVVESYRLGHVTFTEAMEGIHRVSVGCWAQVRVRILGLTAVRLLRTVPAKRRPGQRSPAWPLWIQNATADLILTRQDQAPGVRRSPRHSDVATRPADRTSPIIQWAMEILTSIGWFGDAGIPTSGTVDDWVRKRQRSPGPPPKS